MELEEILERIKEPMRKYGFYISELNIIPNSEPIILIGNINTMQINQTTGKILEAENCPIQRGIAEIVNVLHSQNSGTIFVDDINPETILKKREVIVKSVLNELKELTPLINTNFAQAETENIIRMELDKLMEKSNSYMNLIKHKTKELGHPAIPTAIQYLSLTGLIPNEEIIIRTETRERILSELQNLLMAEGICLEKERPITAILSASSLGHFDYNLYPGIARVQDFLDISYILIQPKNPYSEKDIDSMKRTLEDLIYDN